MLVTALAQTFGDDATTTTTTTPGASLNTPDGALFVNNAILLSQIEQSLRTTYSVITAALAGFAPTDVIPVGIQMLMHDHNDSLTTWQTATSTVIAAYTATKSQLPADQQGVPQYPPAFTQVPATAGFGAVAPFVPNPNLTINQIQVVYGPADAPITTAFGDALAGRVRYPRAAFGDVLPTNLKPLAWLAGIAIVAFAVDWAIANYRSGEIAANHSAVVQSNNRQSEAATRRATFDDALKTCISGSTDASTQKQCVTTAADATAQVYAGLPEINTGASGSWLTWVAVSVLAIGAGVGGFAIYRHYQTRDHGEAMRRRRRSRRHRRA